MTASIFSVSVTYQTFYPHAHKDNADMLLFRWQLIISIMSICHMWGMQRASVYQSGLNGGYPTRTDASCPRKCPEPWPWALLILTCLTFESADRDEGGVVRSGEEAIFRQLTNHDILWTHIGRLKQETTCASLCPVKGQTSREEAWHVRLGNIN